MNTERVVRDLNGNALTFTMVKRYFARYPYWLPELALVVAIPYFSWKWIVREHEKRYGFLKNKSALFGGQPKNVDVWRM